MTEAPYDKFIWHTDVAEEIRVFPDYIQYNTRCWPCWIDYTKYNYKIEWTKLFVKAFESSLVEFWEDYEETAPFELIKNWEVDKKVASEYRKFRVQNWKRIHYELKKEYKDDPMFQTPYTLKDEKEDLDHATIRISYYKYLTNWHEFKFNWHSRYSERAKKWIIKKVKNENFD